MWCDAKWLGEWSKLWDREVHSSLIECFHKKQTWVNVLFASQTQETRVVFSSWAQNSSCTNFLAGVGFFSLCYLILFWDWLSFLIVCQHFHFAREWDNTAWEWQFIWRERQNKRHELGASGKSAAILQELEKENRPSASQDCCLPLLCHKINAHDFSQLCLGGWGVTFGKTWNLSM